MPPDIEAVLHHYRKILFCLLCYKYIKKSQFYVHHHEHTAVQYLVMNVNWVRGRVAFWNSHGIEVDEIWSQLILLAMLSLFHQYN